MAESRFAELEGLCRSATSCDACFRQGTLPPALINVPQPRWVGAGYWSSDAKTLIVLLNPGSGNGYAKSQNARYLELLRSFRDGSIGLQTLFDAQRIDIPSWGRGRFIAFLEGLRLDLDQIALANIAWCATDNNTYPKEMLSRCFSSFTSDLIEVLDPDLVLLSGGGTHRFRAQLEAVAPRARVLSTLHYAHRKGRTAEEQELATIRSLFDGPRPREA